ncbi:MAG: zinc ribbon domain-containing protein [Acidimicrobiia bacterium]
MSPLEQLLVVQEHDSAIDHLRHRRATLPEREVLARSEARIRELEAPITEVRGRRDVVVRDVKRLEDEAEAVAAKVREVDAAMYSGSITSPKELQAMQADIEQLRRHQSSLEDRELELMESQETIDAELRVLLDQVAEVETAAIAARDRLAELEAEIDAEIAGETSVRTTAADGIDGSLLATYDRCRSQARGVGAARLVGHTCQGCRLTIPATEVARIRKGESDGEVAFCDNCGAILVPVR